MSGPQAPTVITTPFAIDALPADINVVPVAPGSPGLASYQQGFPPITRQPFASGGIAPKEQDFNGLFFDITSNIAYWQAGGGFPYNSAISAAIGGYNKGAILATADGAGYWISLADGNTNNPDTSPASSGNWAPFSIGGITSIALSASNVTLTAVQAARAIIVLTGTLTGNINLVFPTWARSWRIINNTTGAFVITAKTASGNGSVVLAGPNVVCGDGTNVVNALALAGQFTGTYQGVTGAPTATCYYRIAGGIVTITLGVTGPLASSSIAFNMSGVPAFLIPPIVPSGISVPIAMDNSAYVPGGAFVIPAILGGVPRFGFGLNSSSTNWTASGNKLIAGSFSYDLNPGVS